MDGRFFSTVITYDGRLTIRMTVGDLFLASAYCPGSREPICQTGGHGCSRLVTGSVAFNGSSG